MAARRHKRGFTLIELMIGMVVMAILLLAVTLILLMPIRTMRTNAEYATLRRDLSYAVQLMARDIRKAPFNGATVDYGDNKLLLPGRADLPDLWPVTVEYKLDDTSGQLHRYVDGVDQGAVIQSGLTLFRSGLMPDPDPADPDVEAPDGFVLYFELQNPDGEITIDHETFIYSRNK